MKEKVNDSLKNHFRPEFLNRIDETIVFHELSRRRGAPDGRPAARALGRQLEGQGLGIELKQAAKELLAERGYDPSSAAVLCVGRSSVTSKMLCRRRFSTRSSRQARSSSSMSRTTLTKRATSGSSSPPSRALSRQPRSSWNSPPLRPPPRRPKPAESCHHPKPRTSGRTTSSRSLLDPVSPHPLRWDGASPFPGGRTKS